MRTEKTCSKCQFVKPLAAFHRDKRRRDGHRAICASCNAAYQIANAATIQARQASYWINNKDRIRELDRAAHALESPEARAARLGYLVEWRTRNRARFRSYLKTYRARLKQNGGHHTRAEWLALCARHNGLCAACSERKPLLADHVLPVSKGGRNDISNIQPLCSGCNRSKGARHIDYRQAS